MAKSTRSSARSSPSSSAPGTAGSTGKKRGSNPLGVGGTLVTILLAVLLWWLNGGQPTSNPPTTSNAIPPTSTSAEAVTVVSPTADVVAAADNATATESATATAEQVATDAPTPTLAPPTATAVPPTATARPAPTTKLPKPTPAPTSKAKAGPAGMATITHNELPPEALETLALIETDGPFPYERDGITFQNRERLLPSKPRGYYREYTVITPGENDRGARRIIAGENGERYYTDDHYESFYWIVEQ